MIFFTRVTAPSVPPELQCRVSPAITASSGPSWCVAKEHPLCLIGDSGTGKSRLLIGLGTGGRHGRLPSPLNKVDDHDNTKASWLSTLVL